MKHLVIVLVLSLISPMVLAKGSACPKGQHKVAGKCQPVKAKASKKAAPKAAPKPAPKPAPEPEPTESDAGDDSYGSMDDEGGMEE